MNAVKNNNISIIGVPLQYGADHKGVDMGPGAIRGSNVHQRLEYLGYRLQDKGDILVNRSTEAYKAGEKLKHLKEIHNVNSQLCQVVSEEMGKGQFPLVLGGDHSIAIGTIKGVLQHVSRLGVIWFDAHTDVNTHETTYSGNIHGMSLAVALGYGHPDLVSIGGIEKKLYPRMWSLSELDPLIKGKERF